MALQQNQSSFFSLPRELREMVYKLTLADVRRRLRLPLAYTDSDIATGMPLPTPINDERICKLPLLCTHALLLTCKRIRDEATSCFPEDAIVRMDPAPARTYCVFTARGLGHIRHIHMVWLREDGELRSHTILKAITEAAIQLESIQVCAAEKTILPGALYWNAQRQCEGSHTRYIGPSLKGIPFSRHLKLIEFERLNLLAEFPGWREDISTSLPKVAIRWSAQPTKLYNGFLPPSYKYTYHILKDEEAKHMKKYYAKVDERRRKKIKLEDRSYESYAMDLFAPR